MPSPLTPPLKSIEIDDPRVDLAIQRTEWALERTQLSWVRTAFAVISAGLALDKGTEALHEARLLKGANWVEGGHIGGVILSLAASFLLLSATLLYHQRARQLAAAHGRPFSLLQPCVVISWLVVALGFVVAGLLLTWG